MNERIKKYVAEVFADSSKDAKAVIKRVEEFESEYNTVVENILYYEDEEKRYFPIETIISFKSLAFFCQSYWVAISLEPKKKNLMFVSEYPYLASLDCNSKIMEFRKMFSFPNIVGDIHWAKDVMRMHVIPNFRGMRPENKSSFL